MTPIEKQYIEKLKEFINVLKNDCGTIGYFTDCNRLHKEIASLEKQIGGMKYKKDQIYPMLILMIAKDINEHVKSDNQ